MKRLVISLITCLFAALPLTATAQSMHNLQALADAAPNSIAFDGKALWISFNYEGYADYPPARASMVKINKCWGLAAGHSFLSDGYAAENHVAGNGSNWMNDQGTTVPIAEHYVHPTWQAGNGVWDGSRIDLTVARFAEPFPEEDVEIGTLSIGEVFEYSGFGRPATPATGLLPSDGQRRAFDAKAHGWGYGVGAISTDYVHSTFWASGSQYLPMGGVGVSGSSGSGGFKSPGELVALAVRQAGGSGYASATIGVRLNLFKDWIESYTNDENACVPPSKSSPPLAFLCRDRRLVASAMITSPQLYDRCRRHLLTSFIGTALQ